MNLYFLVEGKRTERRVYPARLEHLLPQYTKVLSPAEAGKNCYYLVSSEGYPQLLGDILSHAIADINDCGRYDYFVICLDADECSVSERLAEVEASVKKASPALNSSVTLKVIVQNRSIETWFLGNRAVFPRNPNGKRFREMAAFYDVSKEDPEEMGVMNGYTLHAEFHLDYLLEMFRERSMQYTKKKPGPVLDATYLRALMDRTTQQTPHLPTFGQFVSLCDNVNKLTT